MLQQAKQLLAVKAFIFTSFFNPRVLFAPRVFYAQRRNKYVAMVSYTTHCASQEDGCLLFILGVTDSALLFLVQVFLSV